MITVYKKPACFGCTKTIEKFTGAGIEHVVVDVTESPDALAYITDDLGYQQAPVVVVSEHDHWSGLQPAQIDRVIRAGATDAETVEA